MKRYFRTRCWNAVVTGAVLAAAPLASSAQTPMADSGRRISLAEAVQMAQRNSPSTIQARGTERLVAAQHRTAIGAYIPTLSMSAGTGRTEGTTFDNVRGDLVPLSTTWSYSNTVSTNLELFDGFRRWRELGRVRAAGDAASAQVVSSRFDAALQAKQQYYAALAARESEAAARAQLEQAEQQLKASTARVTAGVATKSDSLRSAIAVGNARLAVLTAQSNLRVANAALTRVIGSETLVTPQPNDTLELPPSTIQTSSLEQLVGDAPAVLLAEANLAAAQASRRAQRSQYLPTVSMSYNYNFSQSGKAFQGGNLFLPFQQNPNRQTLNFNLSYPIFNGFSREQQSVQNSIAVTNQEAAVRDARLAARQTLTTLMSSLQNANARVEIQIASIAAAEEDLRVQQQRYALGASTLLDLLTSQTQLNQARTGLIQARFDARVAKAQLESLVGRDL